MSLNHKLVSCLNKLASRGKFEAPFLPPSLFEQEETSGGPCTVEYEDFNDFKRDPVVRQAVIEECPTCETEWSAVCDCIAKGNPDATRSRFGHSGATPTERVYTYLNGPYNQQCRGPIKYIWYPERGHGTNWGCFGFHAGDPGYTESQWYGDGPGGVSLGGAWAKPHIFSIMMGHLGFTANEIMFGKFEIIQPDDPSTPENEEQVRIISVGCVQSGNCRELIDRYTIQLVGNAIPNKWEQMMLEKPCSRATTNACCEAAGDFGGFSCREVLSADECFGQYHANKSCSDIGDNNCGGV